MTQKRHFTDVKFGYHDGRRDTVRLMIGYWQDGDITIEGDDLDMVTAAYFHLFGHAVSPGIKHYGLREYKNGAVTHIVDDRCGIYGRRWKKRHPLSWSLMESDGRPGELRLWVQSTETKMFMNFMMDKPTTEEFGRRLAVAAEWEVAA